MSIRSRIRGWAFSLLSIPMFAYGAPEGIAAVQPPMKAVESVERTDLPAQAGRFGEAVQLGDEIVVKVNPDFPVQTDPKAPATQPLADIDPGNLVLFLDGRPLTDLTPFPPSGERGLYYFVLKRTDENKGVWVHILAGHLLKPHAVPVSIGLKGGAPLPSDARLKVRSMPLSFALPAAVLIFGLLVAIIVLGRRTALLRDPVPLPAAQRPFSLARTQAIFWLFVITASFILIVAVESSFENVMTGSSLVLLGIGSFTTVTAASLDKDMKSMSPDEIAAASAEAGSSSQIKQFIKDILSDGDGVSPHRFQMVVFTIVLGVVFLYNVFYTLSMPTFDSNLLALMGLSSGAYVAGKATEPK